MIIRHVQLKSHTNMCYIQVCHDVGTLFIDRDGTTVLLEIRVYHYLSLTIGDPVDVTTLLLLLYQWSSAHGCSLDEES